jgi:hypothetical protein
LLVGFLFLPRSTWPEQVGIAFGLAGVAQSEWWIGIPAYLAARGLWAVAALTSSKPRTTEPARSAG